VDPLTYLKVLAFIGFGLATLWSLEALVPASGGLFIGVAETLVEFAAFVIVFRRSRKETSWGQAASIALGVFFASLFTADFFYILFFYLLHLDPQWPLAVCLTKFPYSIAFIAGAVAPLLCLKDSLKTFYHWRLATLALAIALPVAWRFVLEPFLVGAQAHYTPLFIFGEALDVVSSTFLIITAILLFLHTRSLAWSVFSAGSVTLVLGDWAIRHETLLGHTPAFGFYEFFWGFGVFLCSTFVFSQRGHAPSVETRLESSLLNNLNLVGVLMGSASVVLLCTFYYGDFNAVRLISTGTSLFLVVVALLSQTLTDRIRFLAEQLGRLVSERYSADSRATSVQGIPLELKETFETVFETKIQNEQAKRAREREMTILETRAEIARQVAHDIRSPLVALEVGLAAPELPENIRSMTWGAVKRIGEIANSLLEHEKVLSKPKLIHSEEDLASITDSMVAEKRIQYRNVPNCKIEAPTVPRGLFASCDASELKRILSNVIDNAVEALGTGGGKVELALFSKDGRHYLQVSDNGPGISPDVLPQLMAAGKTFGKVGGSGLGLFYAKRYLESCGGAIRLDSDLGKGTTVTITLQPKG
jgi:signal transduction histidine kinase